MKREKENKKMLLIPRNFSKMRIIVLVLIMGIWVLSPMSMEAKSDKSMSLLVEGGKSWGSVLNGILVSGKLFLPLTGKLSIWGGYTHYLDPQQYDQTIKRQGLGVGLQFKTPKDQRRLQWFVHGGAGLFNSNYYPLIYSKGDKEVGISLGTGLEKPLSRRLSLRFDLRVWTFFYKDAFFGDSWAETTLGLVWR